MSLNLRVVLLFSLVLSAVGSRNYSVLTNGGSTSPKANEFYIGFFQNYAKPAFAQNHLILNRTTIFIMNDNDDGVTVTITDRGRESIHFVQSGRAAAVRLQKGTRLQGASDRNKGIRVKAEGNKQIALAALNEELHSVEGFSALPCKSLPNNVSYKYYAVSVPRTATIQSSSADSSFLIVACRDNTTVTVTPSQTIASPNNPSQQIRPDESFDITLHEMQTLYIESLEDLTGSHAVSNKPISFLSGHECGNVPYNVSECDHLVEQLPPTATWGTLYLTAPTATRATGDIYKILSAEGNTSMLVSCVKQGRTYSRNFTFTITQPGGSHNFTTLPDEFCSITSEKRILVVQFTPGRNADRAAKADPFMVVVPAISQYMNKVTVIAMDGQGLFFQNYLNVFIPVEYFNSSAIKLDDRQIDGTWVSITCANEIVCGHAIQVEVEGGVHHLSHDDPTASLGVTVYGLDYLESYAVIGGMNLALSEEPFIMDIPQTSLFIQMGGSICLSCQTEPHYVEALVRWEFNGTEVNLQDHRLRKQSDGSLCIRNATFAYIGNYSCYAGSDKLTYILAVRAGIIVQMPSCRPQPSTEEVVVIGIGYNALSHVDLGSSALEICCVAGGRLTWFVNGTQITGQSGYDIGTNYLRVRGPFTSQCATYTCQTTIGSVTSQESSDVCFGDFGPPTSVMIIGPTEVVEGEEVILECSANGYPEPEKVWTALTDVPLAPNTVDHQNGTLLISALYEGNVTTYCCDVANDRGALSNCITIIILVPPYIKHTPKDSRAPIIPVPLGASLPLDITQTAEIGQEIMVVRTYSLRIDCRIERGYPSPTVTWLHNGDPVSSDAYEVLSNKSLLIESVTAERDNGNFTCEVEVSGVGVDRLTSVLTVIEPPRIAEPSPPFHAPGNCKDLTNSNITSEQVGLDLCVRAGSGAKLYIHCEIAGGNPPPIITWLKDGMHLNFSNRTDFEMFPNGTLFTENIFLPIEALSNEVADTSGVYTCLAQNLAGADNASSYVVPFGDVSAVQDLLRPYQLELYHQLHEVATNQNVSGKEHVILFTTGNILRFDDYNPGRDYDGGEDSIPSSIMENMFDLVDVIPNGENVIAAPEDYQTLSETYDYLLHDMTVSPSETPSETLRNARTYLQQIVTDLGGLSERNLPRLSLYLLYKNHYYSKKLEVENQIDYQKRKLAGTGFVKWYERNGYILQGQIVDAYTKWEIFGSKDEVEQWLRTLNLEDYSEPLDDAQAVLIASKKKSKFKDEKVYYPVEFIPGVWFHLLENSVEESVDQMQFHLAQLQAEKQVLEFTLQFLEQEARRASLFYNYVESQTSVFDALGLVSYLLKEEVLNTEQQRYRCLITRHPIDCHLYSLEYELTLHLMDTYADIYWEAAFIRSATNHRDFSIPAVVGTIESLSKKIDEVDLSIHVALVESAGRDSAEQEHDVEKSVKPFAMFDFSSKLKPRNSYDFMLPSKIRDRLLWHIESASTGLTSKEVMKEYTATMNHLNSFETNVTVKLFKIDIHRRWLKPAVFGNPHIMLRNQSILVSPGALHPSSAFRVVLENGTYKFPLYTTSLILATNIELKVKVPFPFHILPSLLKMSYDGHIKGGVGPFSFGPLFKSDVAPMKFRVAIQDTHVVISLPGTQLVGYICDVIPQHPLEPQTEDRRRRSVSRNMDSNIRTMEAATSKFNQWLSSKIVPVGEKQWDIESFNKLNDRELIRHLPTTAHYKSSDSSTLSFITPAPSASPLADVPVSSNISTNILKSELQQRKLKARRKRISQVH